MTELFTLEGGSFIKCAVYGGRSDEPDYYVRLSFPNHGESFYVSNLPSLLAVLRDLAPLFQADGLPNSLRN